MLQHIRRDRAVIAGVLALLIVALFSGSGATLAAGPTGYTWVWQNPVGTGEMLYSTSAASATAVWSVGAYGAILYWNGTTLTKQASGTTNNLYSVYAQDATHVWAVGEKGTILFYNGTTWAPQGTGVTTYDLNGVSAAATNRVWAVGGYDGFHNAVILYYNGTTWSVQLSQATGGFTDVYARDATHVWAVSIWTWFYNGTTWAKVNDGDSSTGIDPYQISGYSTTNLWAVGWSGKVLYSTNAGTTWNAAPATPNTGTPYGTLWPSSISALDATHIYAVGWGGSIALYNGAAWATQASGTTKDLYDVDIFAAASIFAGGDTKFISYNTPTWTTRTGGTTSQLNAVHGRDANNVWTVGTNVATFGNIQSSTDGGNIWGTQASGTTDTLNGVDYFDSTHLWTAGQNYVRFWSGAAWTSQVDGTVDTITSTVAVQTQPRTAGINTATNKIYVANTGSNTVSVINGATDTVTGTITVGSSPRGVCANPTTNRIYVGNQAGNSVTVIDGATDTVLTTITVGTNPYRLSVNPTTNKIYVANYGSNNVSVINGATNTVSTTIALGNNTGPLATAVNATTNKIYVANYTGNSTSIINGATDTLTKTINVGTGPYGVDVNATTNKIYVVNSTTNNVSVINGTTDTVASTVAVGTTPRGVAANPVTNRIYVANFDSNNISVMDGSTDTVAATIAGGTQPFGANANPVTNKVYISNYGGNNVSVLNGPDRNYYCVTAATTTRVWVGSDYGRVRYYNGTTWALQIPDTQFSGGYYGIAAPDTNHVWAVGASGEIVYWNGTTWAKQASGTTNTLRAVTVINSTTAWASGDGGVICYTNNGGTTWTVQTSGTTQNLLGISAADATHVWAVGMGGVIFFYNGTTWASQTSPTTNNLRAVFAYDSNNAWAVGDNGTIIFADPPYIKACAPGWGNPGDTVDVEVIGGYTNFQASTPTLSFGTGVSVVPGSVNVVDNTHILAQIQVDSGAVPGPRDVNATTAGETPIPLAGGFVVGATPTIASISKPSAPPGWTGDVKITGSQTSFSPASQASFGSGVTVNNVTYRDIYEVTANITVDASAAPGHRSVNVTTGSETPAPLADAFTVTTPPIVAGISSCSPTSAKQGDAIDVDITGTDTNFLSGSSQATFSDGGITVNSTTVTDTTHATANITVAANSAPGQRDVNVITGSETPVPLAGGFTVNKFVPPNSAFYFAEGYTGANFAEYLCLGNPNSEAAKANVTYLFSDGTTKPASYDVPATGRTTVNVNSEVGPDKEVSIQVLSDTANLVAERPMYFNYNGLWTGGSDAVGATAPNTDWYFAEGNTLPNFDQYITVLNPGSTAANLTFHYMVEGQGEKDATGSVGAHSRATFNTKNQIGAGLNASLHLSSDHAVVAERPMYFNYKGVWTGGHDVVGANSPQKQWYLAEGTTREGFEEWLCLQNPGTSPITVTARYLLGQGQGDPINKSYTVPAKQRLTVSVNKEIGPDKDDSVQLTSTGSFIAERPMYFNYSPSSSSGATAAEGHQGASNQLGTQLGWTGGSDVLGANGSAKTWFFAEGTTRDNFNEWLCLQNPGDRDAHATITYYTASGQAINKTWTVSADSRLTVDVNSDAGANLDISARISSDNPIIVERPMYFNYNGWTGGHDVVGF